MTNKTAVELLLRKIEDVCHADNIRDEAKRQEAIFRLAEAHQKAMRELPSASGAMLVDALSEVFNSHARITRRAWNNPSIYCSLVEARLCITGVDADGKPHPWTITESDWFSEDWEVVE